MASIDATTNNMHLAIHLMVHSLTLALQIQPREYTENQIICIHARFTLNDSFAHRLKLNGGSLGL